MFKLSNQTLKEIVNTFLSIDGLVFHQYVTLGLEKNNIKYVFHFKAENDEKQLNMIKEVCKLAGKANCFVQVYDAGNNLAYTLTITKHAMLEALVPVA